MVPGQVLAWALLLLFPPLSTRALLAPLAPSCIPCSLRTLPEDFWDPILTILPPHSCLRLHLSPAQCLPCSCHTEAPNHSLATPCSARLLTGHLGWRAFPNP